jgi:hypothetical protein
MTTKTLAAAGVALAGGALAYRRLLREPVLKWGATADRGCGAAPR